MGMRETRAHFFFFFNDTATTEIYTLSLHDALPISACREADDDADGLSPVEGLLGHGQGGVRQEAETDRSEEHTSELQSRSDLVCRLLLEKKKITLYRYFGPEADNCRIALRDVATGL